MGEPVRIQRKRTRGWRMPPNTVSVTRPSKWGNPFTAKQAEEAGYRDGRKMAVWAYREWLRGNPNLCSGETHHARQRILNDLPELRGVNLACFCPVDRPCHGDVLLELASGDQALSASGESSRSTNSGTNKTTPPGA